MENKKFLLSVCIPTYNGASSSLKEVLDYVIPSLEKHPDEVELIVSDNCSTDSTYQLLEQYSRIPNFRYYRNEKNLGMNGNMLLLVDKYSQGEFSWVVGDDDVINSIAVDYIISCLKQENIELLSVRFKQVFKEQLKTEIEKFYRYTVNCGSYANVLEKNCLRGNSLATFMGSTIFKTSNFREVDKRIIDASFDKYYTVFPNAYIYATAFHNKNCAYISQPVVFAISHEKAWATKDNSYMIQSVISLDLYDYISKTLQLGELPITHRRVLYDYLSNTTIRFIKKEEIKGNYWRRTFEALRYPSVFLTMAANFFRVLFKRNVKDID